MLMSSCSARARINCAPRLETSATSPATKRRVGVSPRRRSSLMRLEASVVTPGSEAFLRPGRPPVGHADAVAAFRAIGSDRDDLDAFRACLERTDRGRSDPHDIPRAQVDDVVVQLDPARPAHHEICLLLLAVAVAHSAVVAGPVAEVADSEVLRIEVTPREPHFDLGAAVSRRVLDLLQIDLRITGHSLAPLHRGL